MKTYLAGNTNSPISFPSNYPEYIISGNGAYVTSQDGKKYIDLWMGYGALLHGHQHQSEKTIMRQQINKGWFFSYPTLLEAKVAKKIHQLIPSAELVRFSVSGSDAVAYALRASRNFTKKHKILAIKGGYHGVHENMISNAGTLTTYEPDLTLFNDTEGTVKKIMTGEYACFILEPILANNGCVPPQPGFLEAVRKACTISKTILIFDEVVVGFRTSINGAQSLFGVTPDISTFSKAVAGGLPLSLVCGKREIMEQFTPTGDVFFAGTFNGSPLPLANALHIMELLENEYPYDEISAFRQMISERIIQLSKKHGIKLAIQGAASMMSLAFECSDFVHGVNEANANPDTYVAFANYMAKEQNILLPPMFTETIFLAPVHIELEAKLIDAFDKGLSWLASNINQKNRL